MIKRFLFLALLLAPFQAFAWGPGGENNVNETATAGDSCTGTLIHSWHMETDDVTTGTPAGCSTEDTSPTYQSGAARTTDQFYDGASAIHGDGASSRAEFTTATDLVSDGKISGRCYVGTGMYADAQYIWYNVLDTSNRVFLSFASLGDAADILLLLTHTGGGTADTVNIPASSGRAEGEWFYFEAGWIEETAAGNDMYVKTCDADGTTNCVTAEADNDPAASTGSNTVFAWGGASATVLTSDGYIDNGKVYNASGY